MDNREEFERLIKARTPTAQLIRADNGEYIVPVIQTMWQGYQLRQPEIDALKAENRGLADLFQKKVDDCAEMEIRMRRENTTLQAEVERLGQLIESLSRSSRAEIAGLNKDVAKLKALIGATADIDPDHDCPC